MKLPWVHPPWLLSSSLGTEGWRVGAGDGFGGWTREDGACMGCSQLPPMPGLTAAASVDNLSEAHQTMGEQVS